MRKLIFALIEAEQNLARRRRKILTFRRGDPLEIDQFWCLPEYKLVKFGAHFAGIEAGRQFPKIWPILVILHEFASKKTSEIGIFLVFPRAYLF